MEQPKITSYEEAEAYLRGGGTKRTKQDRRLPGRRNSTRLQRRDNGDIAVKFHQTDVVTYRQNGDIVLSSGGWKTKSTKERIGTYTPGEIGDLRLIVYQEKGVWYLGSWGEDGDRHIFEDGLTVHPDGTVSGAGDPRKIQRIERLKKRIRTYARGYIDALAKEHVPPPSAGDCWYCSMRPAVVEDVQLGRHTGKSASGFDEGGTQTLGEAFGDTEHLVSHMRGRTYVPALLLRALEAQGASATMRWAAGEVWYPERFDNKRTFIETEQDRLYTALYKHLYSQFGIAA